MLVIASVSFWFFDFLELVELLAKRELSVVLDSAEFSEACGLLALLIETPSGEVLVDEGSGETLVLVGESDRSEVAESGVEF